MARRLAKVDLANESIQRLEPLDGVAVDTGAKSLPDNAVEINKDLSAQHMVELIGSCRILAHKSLHRCRFVGGVVVDVHARIAKTTLDDQIDKLFERRLLLGRRERPHPFVVRAAVRFPERISKEVFKAALLGLPIPFEIEEHVER